MGKHTPIADLLADYEANGCDHSDMAWVRAAARRYVETMPDSQARCLLHVLAQEPAEAQAQGGGEAVCDCPGEGRRDPVLHAPNCPVRTAPPSAPVGVEGIEEVLHQVYMEHPDSRLTTTMIHDMAVAVVQSLAQQPAAVDGAALREVVDFLCGIGELEGRNFGDAPPYDLAGRRTPYWWREHLRRAAAPYISAQPGGSDNDR